MNERVKSGMIYAGILIAILVSSIWLRWTMYVLVIAVAFLGSLELGHALSRKFRPISVVAIFIGSLSAIGPILMSFAYGWVSDWYLATKTTTYTALWQTDMTWYAGMGFMAWLGLFVLIAFTKIAVQLIQKGPAIMPHVVAESAASFYLSMPLAAIGVLTYAIPDGFKWVALALVMPSIVDVSAYYVGIRFGKRHILPEISPKKTLAGLVGGMVIPGLVVGLLTLFLFNRVHEGGFVLLFALGFLSGVLMGLASQVGDWVASALKRYCGLKDFSHLLPGHGGILDRFDSVLYCVPVAMGMALFFNLLVK